VSSDRAAHTSKSDLYAKACAGAGIAALPLWWLWTHRLAQAMALSYLFDGDAGKATALAVMLGEHELPADLVEACRDWTAENWP